MNFSSKWILYSFVLLLALPSGASAMQPCEEKRSFEENVNESDLVAEGRYIGTGVYAFVNDPKYKLHELGDDYGEMFYLATRGYSINKTWKGLLHTHQVKVIAYPFPLPEPVHLRGNNINEKKAESILLLKKSPEIEGNIYYSTGCEDGYPLTAENMRILEKKFPAAQK